MQQCNPATRPVALSTTRSLFGLPGCATGVESAPSAIGLINLEVKSTGKPGAGKRHAGFDVAGVGNVIMGVGLRASAKVLEIPPDPTIGAPVPDPTGGRGGASLPYPYPGSADLRSARAG